MDRYWDRLALAVIALVLLGGLLRQCWVSPEEKPEAGSSVAVSREGAARGEPSFAEGDGTERIYQYVLSVIAHGSHRFHFPGGEMEGGFLEGMEARKAACYVMELQGRRCPDKEASRGGAMYYTSVCGGCHGNDGKGVHGNFPDLTRRPLLGIEYKK